MFLEKPRGRNAFLLKGFAGTGKTTVISTLVKVLEKLDIKYVLLAPTGRASKVMAGYSGAKAFTIHKHIYMNEEGEAGLPVFSLRKNYTAKTIYIVDEASMISDNADTGDKGVLNDLMEFVYERKSNKLILVGDTAQLPPVGQELSPALDSSILKPRYDLDLIEMELTEVVRQEQRSGILENATELRETIGRYSTDFKFLIRGFPDMFKMTSARIEEGLRYAYNKFGQENCMIITRSNKNAAMYNKFIRNSIHFFEEEIVAGDILMAVKNNYNVLAPDSPAGFIANGDFLEIKRIRKIEEMHGFRFATLTLSLVDLPEEPEFECKVILDVLHSSSPALTPEENRKLYNSVCMDYADIRKKQERILAIKNDGYLNALQVKFAYALTCHKSQGGQWDAVFVDQGYVTEDTINRDYFRWLYTAITRGKKEVFLVDFHQRFF